MEETRRIVLLGKTGAGKSSLANTIFRENVFTVNHTPNSETKECRAETRSVNGRSITLIDTPGFFDIDMRKEKQKTEIVKCITDCAPGPHVFLILLKVEKLTEHEKSVIGKIWEYFSEEALKYAAVVFTHGDQLEEGIRIEEFVSQNKHLRDLVRKCGGRCHIVDNKYWRNNQQDEYRSNQFQVAELLNTIDKMVLENNGGYFFPDSDRRIILLGKTGAGKSSTANTIFGEKVFRINHGPNPGTSQCAGEMKTVKRRRSITSIVTFDNSDSDSECKTNNLHDLKPHYSGEEVFKKNQDPNTATSKCEKENRFVNGRSITLIDTPGFFDPDKSEEDLRDEIVKCIVECAPGPHAFLILLKIEKFTDHEKQVIDEIRETFSKEAFKHDEYKSNQFQVAEILNTIDKIVKKNEGGCYTNEMLQRVEKEIQQEEKRIRLLSVTISEQEIREQAKANVSQKLLIRLAGITTGALLGALLGVAALIFLVISALTKKTAVVTVAANVVEAAVGAAGGAVGGTAVTTGIGIVVGCAAAAGAVGGGFIGYHEADQADSIEEAVKNTAKSIWDKTTKF